MKKQSARILIVDDDPLVGEIIGRWLTSEGHVCETALSGEKAAQLLEQNEFHLIIADIMMPGMSGVDLLTFAKSRYSDLAVIMVTGVDDRDTAIITFELGAYGYILKPFHFKEVILHVANALERRRLELLSRECKLDLEKKIRDHDSDSRQREEEMVSLLISTMGERCGESRGHLQRVGLYASVMARYLRWDSNKIEDIRLAAALHDLGKVRIPDRILLKDGKLTPEENREMKKHPELGATILSGSSLPVIQMARDIAWAHHEKWDGSGYPRRLSGEFIPEAARIVAIVDTYDELTHNRPSRSAMSREKAVEVIQAFAREWFDPRLVDYFVTLLPHIREIGSQIREG